MSYGQKHRNDPATRTYAVVKSDSALAVRPRWLYAHDAGVLHYKDDFDAVVKQWPHAAQTIIPLGPTHVLLASTGTTYTAVV